MEHLNIMNKFNRYGDLLNISIIRNYDINITSLRLHFSDYTLYIQDKKYRGYDIGYTYDYYVFKKWDIPISVTPYVNVNGTFEYIENNIDMPISEFNYDQIF